jgi:hypothetical protein
VHLDVRLTRGVGHDAGDTTHVALGDIAAVLTCLDRVSALNGQRAGAGEPERQRYSREAAREPSRREEGPASAARSLHAP